MPRNPNCTNCTLSRNCHTVCMWGSVPTPCDIMVVGRDPGEPEDLQGMPFVGPAGTILNSWLKIAGLDRHSVYISYMVKCRPPANRKPTEQEKLACFPYLEEEIRTVKPKIIIALGSDALEILTGLSQIMKVAGTFIDSERYGCKIFAAFQPAFVLRRDDMKVKAENHFKTLRETLTGKPVQRIPVQYINATDFSKLPTLFARMAQQKRIAVDSETTGLDFVNHKILCFSFSWKEASGVVLPLCGYKQEEIWTADQLAYIKSELQKLFANPAIEWIGHNISFDMKFFKAYGIDIEGPIHDTMLLSTLIDENARDLKGLKPLAQLHTDLGNYNAELENIVGQLGADNAKEIIAHKKTLTTSIKMTEKGLESTDTFSQEEKEQLRLSLMDLELELDALEEKNIHDISYDQIPIDVLWKYAATDADDTIRVFNVLIKMLQKESDDKVAPFGKDLVRLYSTLVMPLRKVLNDIEYRGALLDIEYLKHLDVEYTKKESDIEIDLLFRKEVVDAEEILLQIAKKKMAEKFYQLKNPRCTEQEYADKRAKPVKFNMNSPTHLAVLLYQVLKLPMFKMGKPHKDGKVNPSTDKEVLEHYAEDHDFIHQLMENRKLQKLHKTYVKGMQKRVDSNNRIHTNFNQHIAVTGRLSSSNPNLQNIPRENKDIKKAFIAPPEWSIVQADFSQAEFRFWALYSQDPLMIHDIATGVDIHRVTASEFWGIPPEQVTKHQRQAAKFVVFGLMYGRGAESVAKQVKIGVEEAKQIIENFFNKYPVAAAWLERTRKLAHARRYIFNHFGRIRRLPLITSFDKKDKAEAMRQAVNAPIQGGAADMTGVALIRIWRELKKQNLRAKLIVTVHDSIAIECPDEELTKIIPLMRACMTTPIRGINVKMDVEIESGKNWGELTVCKEDPPFDPNQGCRTDGKNSRYVEKHV